MSFRVSWHEYIFRELLHGALALRITSRTCAEDILAAAELLATTLDGGGTVFFIGNGGSASDAQHLAAELVGRFQFDRQPMSALALTPDSSVVTALANDYGYECVFERQVRGLCRAGDCLVAISTSGNSENIIRAAAAAKDLSVHVIALTGPSASRLTSLADISIRVPVSQTSHIQEAHIAIGQILCGLMEQRLVTSDSGLELNNGAEFSDLGRLRSWASERGFRIVWTNGCFDLLHDGHLLALEFARSLGDMLVVGLNSDASVARLKGNGRPIMAFEARRIMLLGLEVVDVVIELSSDDPITEIEQLEPDIYCKGPEYAEILSTLPEAEVLHRLGTRVVFAPVVSTTRTSELAKRLLGSQ